MPFEIVRNDITQMKVDAIVSAANARLASDGGVNGAIHRAAGPEMDEACRALGGCCTGEAKITPGFLLPCRYVIHTVGPVWRGGLLGESGKLAQCYAASLALAKQHGVRSIAFPVISSGRFGFPAHKALRIAADVIRDFLDDNDMQIYLVLFDDRTMQAGSRLYGSIRRYIDDNYAAQFFAGSRMRNILEDVDAELSECIPDAVQRPACPRPVCAQPTLRDDSLEAALGMIDESFSEMVLRLIDERGWKDSVCYKRANLDRKHFSKIRSNPQYKPKKATALALAVALQLTLAQTQELLMKAGFALSHSSRADIIVEYFIIHGRYDIDEINIALMDFDQPILGG